MFPPQLPHVFISWLTAPGDGVYDPFAGRGTVALQAVLTGRRGYASDANPLAAALSAAKVNVPSRATLRRRITQLEQAYRAPSTRSVPTHIRMLYSEPTLQQLVFLRSELIRERPTDGFLVAMLLGLLHGNHSKHGATRGLSISMPNTFAMAPGYVSDYIKKHGLVAPNVDVFQMLGKRLGRLGLPEASVDGGAAWVQDAQIPAPEWLRRRKVKLVLTSPPYLQVIKYGKYNWVRLWFLGEDPKAVDERLTDTASLERYRAFIGSTLANVATVLRRDGFACLVIGDVRRRRSKNINLARDVWEKVAAPMGWQLHGIVADQMPVGHKVSRIWKDNPGRATKTDRIVILSRGDGDAHLPALARLRWETQSEWPSRGLHAGGSA
jgi:hypothetical protein